MKAYRLPLPADAQTPIIMPRIRNPFRIVALQASVLTDALDANITKWVLLELVNSGVTNLPFNVADPFGPGQLVSIQFAEGLTRASVALITGQIAQAVPLPRNLILDDSWEIRLSLAFAEATDLWQSCDVWIEELI